MAGLDWTGLERRTKLEKVGRQHTTVHPDCKSSYTAQISPSVESG